MTNDDRPQLKWSAAIEREEYSDGIKNDFEIRRNVFPLGGHASRKTRRADHRSPANVLPFDSIVAIFSPAVNSAPESAHLNPFGK